MNLQHVFGIDIGTGSVKIYDRNNDTILKEMNMIAIRNGEEVFAVGNDAYEMFEKTPEDIALITPMNNGRIHDVMMMEAILHTLLRRSSTFVGYMPAIYFSVPLDMTELERRAYTSIARKGRFRRSHVYFVERPVADALSMDLPVGSTKGTMVVNIGAEHTEVSIIADERVIISRIIEIGGNTFSTAVISGVRRKNNLLISNRTAQRLKYTLTNLIRDPGEGCKVDGIDTDTGLPRDGVVSSYTVSGCVREMTAQIAREIRHLLDRIPPQIRVLILQDGLYLTGGSTHIPGIGHYLQAKLACPVHVSAHGEYGTVTGLKEIINNSKLRHLAIVPAKRQTIA